MENNINEYEGFVIDNPSKADWAVEKIKEERSRKDIFVNVAKEKIKDLEQKIVEVEEQFNQNTSFLMLKLDEFIETVPAKETKTQKSFDLPSGKLIRKLPKKDFTYDSDNLIDYLKTNATEYVEIQPKAKWGEFKKDLEIQGDAVVRKSTGELVECIKVVEKPSTFEVK